MKRLLVLISFGLTAGALAAGYYCANEFWKAVAINAGTSFMALGVGLIFVNVYLERNARRGAVKSLLILSNMALAQFNNTFLGLCWTKFGRDEWGKIGHEYINANGKPEALRQEVREFLYELAKTNAELQGKLDKMLETLAELSRMVGWNLDASLLESCLDARISIARLKDVTYDGSEEAKRNATEHLLDAHLHSKKTIQLLKTLAGINEDN